MQRTLIAIALIGLPAIAEAQNAARPRKWTVELYGGAASTSAPASGTPIPNFPAGAPFTLASGETSRSVPSWFFGDGAALLNQVLSQFAANEGTAFPRIAPLDDLIRASGGSPGNGGLFGVRVGRALTPKLTAEISLERSVAKMALSDALLDSLASGGDSFTPAFKAFLNTAPVTNLSVTSSVTTIEDRNAQMRLTAAVKWTVSSGKRIEGYLTGGGGLIRNRGDGPQAILTGRYTFNLFGAFPMDQSDQVTVTVNQPKNSAMGMIGGGITFALSSRLGLRADLRLQLSSMKDVTTATAAPDTDTLFPPIVLPTSAGISPGIQFSTQQGVQSTLSGPVQKLTLFEGTGLSKQVGLTVGIFKRF